MNTARLIWRELTGMFVDDGYLAAAILCVVGVAAVLFYLLGPQSPLVGVVLIFGSTGVLGASVMRAKRKS